jgi:hypothetical protein
MGGLARHAAALGALSAVITALAAVLALIVIPWQLAATDRIQRGQTAREIYREFLALTVNRPELAVADWCAIRDTRDGAAYEAYVDYLLYTAEQALDTGPDWQAPMREHLADHLPFLCSQPDLSQFSDPLAALLTDLRKGCAAVPACPDPA